MIVVLLNSQFFCLEKFGYFTLNSFLVQFKNFGYIECKYQPYGGHSCVNIKYQYDEYSKPSIFVFQTGAIIITGAKTLHQIIMSYHFIIRLLNRYYDEIKILELDQKAIQREISKFFKAKELAVQ